MESELSLALREYAEALEAQLKEVNALRAKQTKAGALRTRKNSLALAAQGKDIRKITIAEIG